MFLFFELSNNQEEVWGPLDSYMAKSLHNSILLFHQDLEVYGFCPLVRIFLFYQDFNSMVFSLST